MPRHGPLGDPHDLRGRGGVPAFRGLPGAESGQFLPGVIPEGTGQELFEPAVDITEALASLPPAPTKPRRRGKKKPVGTAGLPLAKQQAIHATPAEKQPKGPSAPPTKIRNVGRSAEPPTIGEPLAGPRISNLPPIEIQATRELAPPPLRSQILDMMTEGPAGFPPPPAREQRFTSIGPAPTGGIRLPQPGDDLRDFMALAPSLMGLAGPLAGIGAGAARGLAAGPPRGLLPATAGRATGGVQKSLPPGGAVRPTPPGPSITDLIQNQPVVGLPPPPPGWTPPAVRMAPLDKGLGAPAAGPPPVSLPSRWKPGQQIEGRSILGEAQAGQPLPTFEGAPRQSAFPLGSPPELRPPVGPTVGTGAARPPAFDPRPAEFEKALERVGSNQLFEEPYWKQVLRTARETAAGRAPQMTRAPAFELGPAQGRNPSGMGSVIGGGPRRSSDEDLAALLREMILPLDVPPAVPAAAAPRAAAAPGATLPPLTAPARVRPSRAEIESIRAVESGQIQSEIEEFLRRRAVGERPQQIPPINPPLMPAHSTLDLSALGEGQLTNDEIVELLRSILLGG